MALPSKWKCAGRACGVFAHGADADVSQLDELLYVFPHDFGSHFRFLFLFVFCSGITQNSCYKATPAKTSRRLTDRAKCIANGQRYFREMQKKCNKSSFWITDKASAILLVDVWSVYFPLCLCVRMNGSLFSWLVNNSDGNFSTTKWYCSESS